MADMSDDEDDLFHDMDDGAFLDLEDDLSAAPTTSAGRNSPSNTSGARPPAAPSLAKSTPASAGAAERTPETRKETRGRKPLTEEEKRKREEATQEARDASKAATKARKAAVARLKAESEARQEREALARLAKRRTEDAEARRAVGALAVTPFGDSTVQQPPTSTYNRQAVLRFGQGPPAAARIIPHESASSLGARSESRDASEDAAPVMSAVAPTTHSGRAHIESGQLQAAVGQQKASTPVPTAQLSAGPSGPTTRAPIPGPPSGQGSVNEQPLSSDQQLEQLLRSIDETTHRARTAGAGESDGYGGLLGEGGTPGGGGDDGDGGGDGDDGGDSDDSADDDLGDDNLHPKPARGRWDRPQWLMDQYRRLVSYLNPKGMKGQRSSFPLEFSPTPLAAASFFLPESSPLLDMQLAGEDNLPVTALYRPKWFYWNPMALLQPNTLACSSTKSTGAKCEGVLGFEGFAPNPRRTAGLVGSVYIITVDYRCRTCRTKVRASQPQVLAQLSPSLRDCFAFKLSHRGGVTTEVATLFRDMSAHGFGSKQFSNLLATRHRHRYDQLERDWRGLLYSRGKVAAQAPMFDDPSGNAGYVPTSKWFALLLCRMVEDDMSRILQHMSLLSLDVASIDHSHKIPKQIAKVDGHAIFAALLTVLNEYGEIRHVSLVPTKAHTQFADALTAISNTLKLRGHQQPQLMYTDNIAGDAPFLRNIFPSLKHNLAPSKSSSGMPWFDLPKDIETLVVKSTEQLNNQLARLTTCVPHDGSLAVGFDAEWNVRFEHAGGGAIAKRITNDRIGVVQLAYESETGPTVVVVQLARIVKESGRFPLSLHRFLTNPAIRKVGVSVKQDLNLVRADYEATFGEGKTACDQAEVAGDIDLGALAKRQGLSPASGTKTWSLASLSLQFLKLELAKPSDIRISDRWEQKELDQDHVDYAAKDALCSLRVYQALIALPRPHLSPLSWDDKIPGTRVVILDKARHPIARGVIHHTHWHLKVNSNPPQRYHGVDWSKTNAIIAVTQVLSPSAILSIYKKSLSSFSQPDLPPRFASCPVEDGSAVQAALGPGSSLFSVLVKLHDLGLDTRHSTAEQSTPQFDAVAEGVDMRNWVPPAFDDDEDDDLAMEDDAVDGLRNGQLPALELDEGPELAEDADRDEDSQETGRITLKGFSAAGKGKEACDSSDLPVSRVLLDIWHLMDRIPTPKRHGALAAFMRDYSNVLFVVDAVDKRLLSARFARANTTWEAELRRNPTYIWKRVRRYVPSPQELVPRLYELFMLYGPIKDAKTDTPLFNKAAWAKARAVLETVQGGWISDPPGVSLYRARGPCRGRGARLNDGVQVYACFRGTNGLEGGVHRNLRDRFPLSGVTPREANARLHDYVLRHNLVVGTFNRTGLPYAGHYDLGLSEELALFRDHTAVDGYVPAAVLNGACYSPVAEPAGILPIPLAVVDSCGFAPHDATLTLRPASSPLASDRQAKRRKVALDQSPKPPRHHWLAGKQGLRYAAVHVHTPAERDLFNTLMGRADVASRRGDLQWQVMAKIWSARADGQKVFYKLPEHLSAYHSSWLASANIRQTLGPSRDAARLLRTAAVADSRGAVVRELPSDKVGPVVAPVSSVVRQDPPPGSILESLVPPMAPVTGQAAASASATGRPRSAKARTCRRCGIQGCEGAKRKSEGQVSKCTGACQICGQTVAQQPAGACVPETDKSKRKVVACRPA